MAMTHKSHHQDEVINGIEKGFKDLSVTGLSKTETAYFLAGLLAEVKRPCLIILPGAKDARRFFKELEFFLSESYSESNPEQRRLYDFPAYDISPLTGLSPHREVITSRIQALYALVSGKDPIVVTSTEAALLKIVPKETLSAVPEYMEVGEEVEREQFIQRLYVNGYLRTSLVEERGDYSVRGGVIDIFPPLYPWPLRLEFWGDRLESIRGFDPLSQRSTEHLKEATLLPVSEIIMGKENVKRARSMGRLPGKMQDGFSPFPGQEAWLNHFYSRLDTLFGYFPSSGLLTLVNPHNLEMESRRFTERFSRDAEMYRQEAEERGSPFPDINGLLLGPEKVKKIFGDYQCLIFSELAIEKQGGPSRSIHIGDTSRFDEDIDVRVAGKGRVSVAPLAAKLAQWLEMGARVVLVCRTEQQARRLEEILHNYQVQVEEIVTSWVQVSSGGGLSICLGRLSRGFIWPDPGIYVVSEDEIFGPKRSGTKTSGKRAVGDLNWTSFGKLQVGNLVVHQDHGIGQYGGLCKMEIDKKVNDFVIIEYDNNDRLYVPADRISILQKYIGADERFPKLDRLGGHSWEVAKEKATKSIKEIAKQLVEIYALRKYRKGYAFSRSDNAYREFEATFEHEETRDQIKAIEDVLSDMESENPMDRLICGDVGFGKTEVAIRAAFKSTMDGKQVALLVPTTILAEQHYGTFKKRMDPYGVRVGVLSRFKTKREQSEVIAKVRSGKIDILIGTHRILQKDIVFRELGLLIIDEEQRFGVKQKEALKRYRALVDVLALTATPIPRTLHLSLMGVRDLSIIETPPEDRLAIQTYLTPFDKPTIKHAIEAEVERGGQVFFVHNRVQTIEAINDLLMELVPQARFAIAHGQMKERDLENTMIRFLRREIDVLVCTTIIESGLDIPSVNTIIINETDRFGLSQIYQLRGRVGRSKENAYAYLLLSKEANLTREAEKRLKALMDFSHLGAGIHLAMHDLKIRGGGNILGFSQSGHIAAIGYELYMKLIEQSVAELKGEDWQEEINPEINVDIPAYLPGEYVPDVDVRLNLYRRLSCLREDSELVEVTEEMKDRFGAMPEEVSSLLTVMSVRLLLKKIDVIKLDVNSKTLLFAFSPDTKKDPESLIRAVSSKPKKFQFLSERKLRAKIEKQTPLEGLMEVDRVVRELNLLPVREHLKGSPLITN